MSADPVPSPTTTPPQRPSVPAMDARLGVAVPVLDHGFVRLVDYMGNDAAIVQAARVSYGAGTKTTREDRGLIRYLLRHRHTSPLEMCEIKLHVKLPIFVARQWIRHRTGSFNEVSARYSILPRDFYVPRPENIAVQSTVNKQGRGAVLSAEDAEDVHTTLHAASAGAYETYEGLLNDRGEGTPADPDAPMLARELARSALTLNFYTEWYWKTDLHNLLHFLALRLDPHAQYEIRVYAEVIAAMVRDWCPFAWEAFEDFRVGAVSLSRQEAEMLRDSLRVTGFMVPPSPALSQKDIQAFLARLLPPPVGGE